MAQRKDSTLDSDLRLRISTSALDTFQKKSMSVTGKPYQMFLREIIDAFNQGRLRIIPSTETKTQISQLGELHNVD